MAARAPEKHDVTDLDRPIGTPRVRRQERGDVDVLGVETAHRGRVGSGQAGGWGDGRTCLLPVPPADAGGRLPHAVL
ncbi:hypothetical protein GCM10010300_79630 [Streptomyces olivaceoviridis]|nr:hypothetical protein GCM10010300_79630 [Streptomyces olivaceoviridis]